MIDQDTSQDWMAQAIQEIDRLPANVSHSLSFVSGVIASHPSSEARASALQAISAAARSIHLVIAADEDHDHLCPICDAEREVEQ